VNVEKMMDIIKWLIKDLQYIDRCESEQLKILTVSTGSIVVIWILFEWCGECYKFMVWKCEIQGK